MKILSLMLIIGFLELLNIILILKVVLYFILLLLYFNFQHVFLVLNFELFFLKELVARLLIFELAFARKELLFEDLDNYFLV